MAYFAVVVIALAVDIVRGHRFVFRSWPSFALQAVAAFLLVTIVATRTLTGWQRAGRRFVPTSILTSATLIGFAMAAGVLAGGFFPDAINYRRRAPEMFFRTLIALVPAAVAVYVVLRSSRGRRSSAASQPAAGQPTVTPSPQEAPLTGEARDAALGALDLLDKGEEALTRFHEQAISGRTITSADAERLWTAMDGPGFVAHLRKMPLSHAVREALLAASVAQTDAAYLIALARGAHIAVGHTAETAREFVTEVAARRGRPGADAEVLDGVARSEAKAHRDTAAGLLQATRFGPRT